MLEKIMGYGLAKGLLEQIGVISSYFISWQLLTLLLVLSSLRPVSPYMLAIIANIQPAARKAVL